MAVVILFFLFFHHLAHAFPPVIVGDVDEVDACWQAADVDLQRLALARGGGHALAEGVEHHSGSQVLACDGDEAAGGVGMEGGESGGFVFHNVLA